MMKKLITPILYALLLLPLTAISVASEMVSRRIGILPEWRGIVDRPLLFFGGVLILLVGIPFFRLTNRLLQRFEKLTTPSIYDHIRQSLFYYLIVILCLSIWVWQGYHSSEEDGYFLVWTGYSLIAIITNYLFLFHQK